MPRRERIAPPTTPWRAMLRGRLASVGLLDAKEQALYGDPGLPTAVIAGYTIGATADPASPIPSEIDLGVQIAQLLAPTLDPADPLAEAHRVLAELDPATITIELTADGVVLRGRRASGPTSAAADPDHVPGVEFGVSEEQVGT